MQREYECTTCYGIRERAEREANFTFAVITFSNHTCIQEADFTDDEIMARRSDNQDQEVGGQIENSTQSVVREDYPLEFQLNTVASGQTQYGVFPPMVVLLLPGGTSPRRGPNCDQLLLPQELSSCQNLSMYIEQVPVYWRPGSFHL